MQSAHVHRCIPAGVILIPVYMCVHALRYSSLEEDKTVDTCRTWFDCGRCARLLAALTTLRLIEVAEGTVRVDPRSA